MAEDTPQPSQPIPSRPAPRHDPVLLTLIVLLIVTYAGGQWLAFTVLAARLESIEQRVTDSAARSDAKLDSLERLALRATQVLKKGQQQSVVIRAPEPISPPAASAAAAPAPSVAAPGPAAEAPKKVVP
jgi:hypothetical protein